MYLDSSVLVKLYVREADSRDCIAMIGRQQISSSELALGELGSALFQKERAGHITPEIRAAAWAGFLADVASQSVHLMKLSGETVRDAVEIMQQVHPGVPLRTLDALHLATYQNVIAGPLFSKDRRMLDAARLLGFPLAG
jgi:predicted nucleic acid-binding protein